MAMQVTQSSCKIMDLVTVCNCGKNVRSVVVFNYGDCTYRVLVDLVENRRDDDDGQEQSETTVVA